MNIKVIGLIFIVSLMCSCANREHKTTIDETSFESLLRNEKEYFASRKKLFDKAIAYLDENSIHVVDKGEAFYALRLFARIKTPQAIELLLERIDAKLPYPPILTNPSDLLKEYPNTYTLIECGWQVVPYLLNYLSARRTEAELECAALVINEVCGKELGLAIIKEHMPEKSRGKQSYVKVVEILEK